MAAKIIRITKNTIFGNCRFCLQNFTNRARESAFQIQKRAFYVAPISENKISKDAVFLRHHVELKRKYLKSFSTKSTSSTEQDLEDIRILLHSKLSHDKQITQDDLQTQMHIVDLLLLNRIEDVSIDEFNNALSTVSPDGMYTLASKIFSLQTKVGEEASIVATPLFKAASLAGDKNAKYSYGQLLFRGAGGLTADPVEAGMMFTELAKEGHPYAQFALAGMHYAGYGVEQSFETSYTLYQVASENGVIQSFNSIGKMYLNGDGVDKDEKKAVDYFMKGAEKGDAHACMSVAHCYSLGKGVDIDYDQAFLYHSKAAQTGYPPAIYNIGTHYFAGKGVGLDMTTAAEYFQRAADLGFTLAEVNLGNMYFHGLGVEQSILKAKELYQKAAPNHHNARLLLEELEIAEKEEQEKDEEDK